MMRIDALRFRLLVLTWLARRWPRNPFVFFADALTLLVDLVCFAVLPRRALSALLGSYAARLDSARFMGALDEPSPRVAYAVRWARGAETKL